MLMQAVFAVAFGLVSSADGDNVANNPRGRYEALLGQIDAASKKLDEAMRNAKGETEQRAAFEKFQERKEEIVGRLLDLALSQPGDEVAIDALAQVVGHRITPLTERALKILTLDYIGSDRLLGPLLTASVVTTGKESLLAERFLREAATKSPHRQVRGMARLYLADVLEARAQMLREVDRHPGQIPPFLKHYGDAWAQIRARSVDELNEDIETLLVELVRDYADVETPRRGPLGVMAQGRLFRLRNLAIGKAAPEIEGEDIDNEKFRLSDYRGKVVLLTFSGNWCGPCRALYPEERRLVERLKDEPFVVLSVNTDQDKDTLRKSIESGEITWRCWRDGGTDGPITIRWGIYSFPSVYILDHEGIIRHTDADVGPDQIDEAVESLVKQVRAAR